MIIKVITALVLGIIFVSLVGYGLYFLGRKLYNIYLSDSYREKKELEKAREDLESSIERANKLDK